MTVEMFDNAINGISAELIEECAYIDIKPRRRLTAGTRYASIAAAFVLCVCAGVFAAVHLSGISSPTTIGDECDHDCNIYGAGEDVSDLDISCDGKLAIIGAGFTDEDIYSLVESNKEIIAANVSGEYDCFGSSIQIYTKGYHHAVLGEKNYVHLDYLTLPVCIDNRIVANLEVFKADGELLYTLNVGGDKWDIINEALEYGDEIAFVFAGYTCEAAVAPDNTIFEITYDSKGTLTAGYDLIATEYNTFSRSALYDSNNYITAVIDSYSYDTAAPSAEETTIPKNTQTEESSEIPIDSNNTVRYDNNETFTYDPASPNVSDDGNVLLIASLMSQMGKTPLRVSKYESELLIQMLNEIEMQPIDYPDPMNIPFGGGYIMEIEGEEIYELLGGRYIKIGGSYYYDNNGKSEELSAKIGDVLYGYYGEP